MDIKLKEINSYEKEIMVNLLWDEIDHDFEKAIRKFSKRIKLPGFRPGKIPRKVLMNQFQSAIEADFIESSLNNYYLQALKEKEIVPVNMGSVSDVDFDHGGHFKFKVTFEVEPQIKLPRMKRNLLKVEKTIYVCDDEDINLAIEEVRNGHAQVKTIEDGAQSGDFVVCDLQEIDTSGVPIIGKKLETRYVKVGQPPFDNENENSISVPMEIMNLDVEGENFITRTGNVQLSCYINQISSYISTKIIDNLTGQVIDLNSSIGSGVYTFQIEERGSFNFQTPDINGVYPVLGVPRFQIVFDYGILDNVQDKDLPHSFTIDQIYPNPFNPSVTIDYHLTNDSEINISIYDLKGSLVEILKKGKLERGYHELEWAPNNVSSGIYFFKAYVEGFSVRRKITFIK